MDPSYIHHSRYVTVSPSNPNFYGSHIYHHNYLPQPPPAPQAPSSTQQLPPRPPPLQQQQKPLPAPPPPPQEQQLRLPAPPPPPPPTKNLYPSYNSQFTFNPNFNLNPKPHNLDHTHHILQRTNDFPRRISVDGDRHHHHQQQQQHHRHQFDSRRDMWDAPRIVPDHRSVADNLEHHHQFDSRPMSPFRSIDKDKHELDTNYRFRERYNNDALEFEHNNGDSNQRVEFLTRRSHFASDPERLNSSNYVILRGSQFDSNELLRNNVRDGVRDRQSLRESNELLRIVDVRDGALDRPSLREANELLRIDVREVPLQRQSFRERDIRDSVIEMLPNSENLGGGTRAFSGKREFYGLDSERYGNNRGSKENSFEHNRTPRKHVQKKSALLRIQKPCHRNRDHDELHYLCHFDGKSGSFRGKDKVLHSDLGMGAEEEREGSPVELDVSFKSNSLVAKTIVTSSSSAVVYDTNLMPKNRKTRKVMTADKNCASFQLNKLTDNSIKLESSRDVVDNASNSDSKDVKNSGKKVAPFAVGEMHDHNSQSNASEGNDSIAKITAETSKCIVSDKVGTDGATSKTSLPKVVKKKKIVKKVLKKVVNHNAHVSGLQSTKKLDELVEADCSTLNAPAASMLKKGVKASKEKITPLGMASDPIVLQPYPNEVTMLCENEKVGGSLQAAMRSKEVSTDVDSGASCVAKIKRKRSGLISPSASASHKEIKIDEGSVNTDNSLHISCNTDTDLVKPLNETTTSDIGTVEGVSKQLSQKGHTLLLENAGTKESSEIIFSVGGNNSNFLSLEENKKHEGHVNRNVFALEMSTTANFNSLASSREKISNSAIGIVDAFGKQPCKSQGNPTVDSSTVEGFPVVLPGRSSDIFALSSSGETGIQNVYIPADCSNHARCSISDSDNICINSEEINLGTGNSIAEKSPPDGVTISVDNGGREGLQNTTCSGGSEKGLLNITDKSKVRSSISEAVIADMLMGPVKATSTPQCVHTTTSLSVKDSSTAKVSVTGSVDVDLQPCPDGVSFLHPSNSTEECIEPEVFVSSGFIGTSPENRKRRKVSACHTGITSQMTSEISERPNTSDLLAHGVGLPSSLNEALIQPEGEVKVSNIDLGNSLAQVSSGVAVRIKDDCSKVDHRRVHSCSALEDSDILNASFSFPTGFGSQRMVNATPVLDGTNLRDDIMCMEGSKAEKKDAVAEEEQSMMCTETTQFKSPSEHQYPDVNKKLPDTDLESDGYHFEKNDLPSSVVDGGVCTSNSNDEIMEFDALSDIGSPEIVTGVPVSQSSNCQASINHSKKASGDEKLPNGKPVVEGISYLFSHATSSQYVKNNLTSDHTPESANLVAGRTVPSPSQNVKVAASYQIPKSGESHGKNQLNLAVSRNQSSRSSFLSTAKRNKPFSTHITKPRTWHRTENSSSSSMPRNKSLLHGNPQPSQFPEKVAKFQSMSYIRKGNSLVRKPAPVAAFPHVSRGLTSSVYQLNSPEFGELKKITGSDSRADVIDPPNFLRAGGVNAPFERPKTPPLPCVAKVPNCTTNLSGDCTSSPFSDPLSNGCSESTSDPQKILEINDELNTSHDAMKISETVVNQTGSVNSLEGRVEMNDGTLVTSNAKRITYVKRKSNQLVAASKQSLQITDKTQGVASDGYYKRRKNQLIRTSVGSQIKQSVNLPDETSILEGKTAPKDIFSRSFGKRSFKVVTKIHQPSRFSLVWTLKSMQSSKDGDSSHCQKVLPSLFPWKRTAYWRRIVQNSISMSNNSSLSTIGKLLLMRKRDAVYTRSSHGFSLRKSKVLSVGGSSLKWSKSIEKRSKKVNEEATLAVAAVGRKKVEQNSAASFSSDTKNRSHSSRERIFRIGSVRYKMDSSRRTLQRISDDESSCSAALDLEKNPKKSYIPRRLVIGTDEYVRIGNGNQLIRDPKKRTRVLASEKVRWSLHTARLRLARKKKYCQFFTRFGKCNKDDGKCPYIHDPSKIAVCTKFLNGLCSNSSCKLTHKVIPERMPDCSYFLQGLCSNKDCPYRHVHVNPKASTCEGFLKGYCADGNECRKKHSYVCPIFEATGSCPLGSKCKLHHPKSRSKGKKIRRSREQKNARGRYFGSMNIEDSEPRIMMSQGHSMQDNGDICVEGKFADYISLDASDEEAGEINDLINAQTTFDDSEGADLQFDDLDELIKPIRIMNLD